MSLVGLMVAGIATVAAATPALAVVPPGAQATPLVGGSAVANCPPAVPAARAVGPPDGETINGVTVGFPAAGRCTPLAADAEGSYTVAGSFASPLLFTAECANTNGVVTPRSGVTVPAGTIVNGSAVGVVTTVDFPAAVTFPGGRTALLNQTTTTATSVTRDAIVFTGGPIVGRVICGQAVYPLAVSAAGASGSPDVAAPVSSDSAGGPSSGLLVGAGIALLVLAQVAIAFAMRRRHAGATA